MCEWIVFCDNKGKELLAYTKDGTFAGEMDSTIELLSFEEGIRKEEIIVKEVER